VFNENDVRGDVLGRAVRVGEVGAGAHSGRFLLRLPRVPGAHGHAGRPYRRQVGHGGLPGRVHPWHAPLARGSSHPLGRPRRHPRSRRRWLGKTMNV
jgi:hypothetical protein